MVHGAHRIGPGFRTAHPPPPHVAQAEGGTTVKPGEALVITPDGGTAPPKKTSCCKT
jgi:hypothetical protein